MKERRCEDRMLSHEIITPSSGAALLSTCPSCNRLICIQIRIREGFCSIDAFCANGCLDVRLLEAEVQDA